MGYQDHTSKELSAAQDLQIEWDAFEKLTVLYDVQAEFSSIVYSPIYTTYLQTIVRYCPRNGSTFDLEGRDGYAPIWLSQQRLRSVGLFQSSRLAERARHVNNFLQGRAKFESGDALRNEAYDVNSDVIHHIDLFQNISTSQIDALLTRQIQSSKYVIFSVQCVSTNACSRADLLSYERWAELLMKFKPVSLQKFRGASDLDPDRILCVLPGNPIPHRSERIVRSTAAKPDADGQVLHVRWEGAFFMHGSLAHVNREICRILSRDPAIDLSIIETRKTDFNPANEPRFTDLSEQLFRPLSAPADIHIRQDFPPHMSRVSQGKYALMQPWEFGYLPQDWVEPIIQHVDEIWCNSQYVRTVYLKSGIPEERLAIVPLGIDPNVFHPNAPPPDIPGMDKILSILKDKFVFLYVGGTIQRKGFDTLLAAYTQEFSGRDDVVLLIKDHAKDTHYKGSNSEGKIRESMNNLSGPRIIYLHEEISADKLAGIFCLANCSVHPYRGEGFCLPALEALACGVPVAATAGGATDDFVDETVGWRIPAGTYEFSEIIYGYKAFVGPTWMFKIEVDDLARLMRDIYNNTSDAAKRGQKAAIRAASEWTWEHTARIINKRMQAMRAAPPNIRGVASQWKTRS